MQGIYSLVALSLCCLFRSLPNTKTVAEGRQPWRPSRARLYPSRRAAQSCVRGPRPKTAPWNRDPRNLDEATIEELRTGLSVIKLATPRRPTFTRMANGLVTTTGMTAAFTSIMLGSTAVLRADLALRTSGVFVEEGRTASGLTASTGALPPSTSLTSATGFGTLMTSSFTTILTTRAGTSLTTSGTYVHVMYLGE